MLGRRSDLCVRAAVQITGRTTATTACCSPCSSTLTKRASRPPTSQWSLHCRHHHHTRRHPGRGAKANRRALLGYRCQGSARAVRWARAGSRRAKRSRARMVVGGLSGQQAQRAAIARATARCGRRASGRRRWRAQAATCHCPLRGGPLERSWQLLVLLSPLPLSSRARRRPRESQWMRPSGVMVTTRDVVVATHFVRATRWVTNTGVGTWSTLPFQETLAT